MGGTSGVGGWVRIIGIVSQEQSEQCEHSKHSERLCGKQEGWRLRVRVSVRVSQC